MTSYLTGIELRHDPSNLRVRLREDRTVEIAKLEFRRDYKDEIVESWDRFVLDEMFLPALCELLGELDQARITRQVNHGTTITHDALGPKEATP